MSRFLQGDDTHGDLYFLRVVIHCSPTKLDATISLGEEVINFFLKEPNYNKALHEIVYGITRHFQTSSLLCEVARRGNLKQLQRLLQNRRNCDVERFFSERDEKGRTPLMWACRNNRVDAIKFILSNGADLYARDSFGQTSFLHACRGNTREVLEFLARRGARIHDIDSEGQHGMHHAARCNTRDVLELLFHKLQADIHIKDWRNRFPIHHAAAAGNIESVRFLIQNRSYLNPRTRIVNDRESDDLGKNYVGMTPLHYAAQNGHANIVRLLVQHGADVDAITDCGRSVITLAAENGHENIAVYCMNESYFRMSEKRIESLSQSREFV